MGVFGCVCCGNPTPVVGDEPRQHPEQRPLHGQVVNGRYYPFNAAALEHSSSRQSGGLPPPGGEDARGVLWAVHAADGERPEWGKDTEGNKGQGII